MVNVDLKVAVSYANHMSSLERLPTTTRSWRKLPASIVSSTSVNVTDFSTHVPDPPCQGALGLNDVVAMTSEPSIR